MPNMICLNCKENNSPLRLVISRGRCSSCAKIVNTNIRELLGGTGAFSFIVISLLEAFGAGVIGFAVGLIFWISASLFSLHRWARVIDNKIFFIE